MFTTFTPADLVINHGTKPMQVFGNGSDTIDDAGTIRQGAGRAAMADHGGQRQPAVDQLHEPAGLPDQAGGQGSGIDRRRRRIPQVLRHRGAPALQYRVRMA
jgi:hypothetical protein